MSDTRLSRRAMASRMAQLVMIGLATPFIPAVAGEGAQRRVSPEGTYRLTRTLVRGLGDGATVVVTRSWRIGISSTAAGYHVEGVQLSAKVEAPPMLAAIASLEQARDASTLFPILLDADGRIVSHGTASATGSLRRGLETAQAILASLPGRDDGDARAFLAELGRASADKLSALPADLFFPHGGCSSSERAVTLPDGETGQVQVTVAAAALPATGLLDTFERRIVTVLGASRRLSSERWSLTPPD